MNTDLQADALIRQLSTTIGEALGDELAEHLVVGIRTGGLWIAERLCDALELDEPASLNISYHRDDVHRRGLNPQVLPSQLPLSLEDRRILLVDDVLHTGRTVRAAINALFDYGRPALIRLAVLVDRGGRQLPVRPDYVAETLQLEEGTRLRVEGPDPLQLRIEAT